MNDHTKKPAIGGFSDMMEMSEKKFAQEEKTGAETKKNEGSLEQKNVLKKELTQERTLKHLTPDAAEKQNVKIDQHSFCHKNLVFHLYKLSPHILVIICALHLSAFFLPVEEIDVQNPMQKQYLNRFSVYQC